MVPTGNLGKKQARRMSTTAIELMACKLILQPNVSCNVSFSKSKATKFDERVGKIE